MSVDGASSSGLAGKFESGMNHMETNQIIYLCENTPDGIFTAIYDAWAAHIPDGQLKLRVEEGYSFELFSQYVYVQTSLDKAVKVARSVSRKIGREAYDMMYLAALSQYEDKIDVIYRFLKLGFRCGSAVTDMHGDENVCRLFDIQRNVKNEAHLINGFIRFFDSENGILIAKIGPKNQVLPLVAPHFADRFPEENFVIIDEVHGMGAFHERRKKWFLSPLDEAAAETIWNSKESAGYERLWKTFFHTIAIKERENYRCQRTMCAIRYRDYMLEFES